MRIIADLASDEILQVEADSSIGSQTRLNGRYSVPVPAGQVDVDTSSYILPVDSGSVVTQAYDNLLASFPNYDHIEFNPLLESTDVQKLDLTGTVDNTGRNIIDDPLYESVWPARLQTGRGTGTLLGQAPTTTAILPVNTTNPSVYKPGVIVTDTIDISAALGGGETDNFQVYWKFYRLTVTEDVMSSFGATAGQNSPALKTLEEVDPNLSDITVALSNNDGNLYTPVSYLEPFTACVPGNQLRLAFINTGTEKVYLASYAVLF